MGTMFSMVVKMPLVHLCLKYDINMFSFGSLQLCPKWSRGRVDKIGFDAGEKSRGGCGGKTAGLISRYDWPGHRLGARLEKVCALSNNQRARIDKEEYLQSAGEDRRSGSWEKIRS